VVTDSRRILLVDGRQLECGLIARALRQAGFTSDRAACPRDAADTLKEPTHLGTGQTPDRRYAGVIIHQNAAGDELLDFCTAVRSADPELVIVISLTRYCAELDCELLDRGADDVITDQHPPAAVARRLAIRLAHRRPIRHIGNIVRIGDACVEFANGRIRRDHEYATMTARDARLLEYLLANAGRTVSRREVHEAVWKGSRADPLGKNIEMYISRLRKLIEPDRKKPIYLKTVRSRGYRLDLPE